MKLDKVDEKEEGVICITMRVDSYFLKNIAKGMDFID